MDDTSKVILSLRPVTFRYKNDSKGIPQFGLVAEGVAKVNPNLVMRDREGKNLHSSLRRGERDVAQRIPQILQEVQERKATVTQLKSAVAQQQKDFTARLKEQDKKIQTVSDKVALTKPAPRTADNN